MSSYSDQVTAGPRTRGRVHARATLVLALLTAVALGSTVFLALDAIDLASLDPFGVSLTWLGVAGLLAVVSFLVVIIAIAAAFRCRPRTTAVFALLASIGLPIIAVVVAVVIGLAVAKAHAVVAVTSDSHLLGRAADVLESWHIPTGPLRGLLHALDSQVGMTTSDRGVPTT